MTPGEGLGARGREGVRGEKRNWDEAFLDGKDERLGEVDDEMLKVTQ